MYSNKENVNILTSLLVDHGVRHAVVCPGSRNAAIVNNLNECKKITCYPVTDERSAGFQAMGLSMSVGYKPVVVCVTSGSALLNLYPAVAEAYYQHIPLVVIAADRPAQWIDQLDGQTLPQPDALGKMVRKAVSLPELLGGDDQEEIHWYCNRLVNEALLACMEKGKGPVLINVPISEPFYEFPIKKLPKERVIERKVLFEGVPDIGEFDSFWRKFKRPLLVVGQLGNDANFEEIFQCCFDVPVLCEPLAMPAYITLGNITDEMDQDLKLYASFERMLDQVQDDKRYRPDLVIYVGGQIVSKRLKEYLRSLDDVCQVRFSEETCLEDTFMHLSAIYEYPSHYVSILVDAMSQFHDFVPYRDLWMKALAESRAYTDGYAPAYSSMLAIKTFCTAFAETEEYLKWNEDLHEKYDSFGEEYVSGVVSSIFAGNSSTVRLMNLFADRRVYCNRGVNGIEGSLSTAVGFSMNKEEEKNVYCVLGDLSFFYDQNALWNQNLRGNLRIIVLNNGGGAIFGKFEGLKQSKARKNLVMACHHVTAEGICQQNHVTYISAHNQKEMKKGIMQLLTEKSERPMLLEVFTDIDKDNQVIEEYYNNQGDK